MMRKLILSKSSQIGPFMFALNTVSSSEMPGMDGPTLVRVLRRIDPQIRIVGVSGMGEDTPVETIESLALSALLTKPFTAENLLFALHAVLQALPGTKLASSASPWRGVSAVSWVPSPGTRTL